ncbi:MFS transporter [Paenibacillus sp. JX-17]|uniref:MFS transporter n=1 Tax=Paenibacillus lacisoli TaxID=3064525 RepID=A0ABT9C6K7_9BACL|nr:MFS transporter [Paenibacillus sp. JX-17]MDO7904894.1 MFS transporter [Paenibacillus sp. JX-17]
MSSAVSEHSGSSGRLHFLILIAVIVIAGISQGLLLPVLSIYLEQMGVSSSLNGLNSAALYIGSFGMTLAAEKLLGRLGFKKLMASGLVLVMVTLLLFPLFPDIRIWFVFRLFVGIGDSALHYAAQLWVLLVTPVHQRGRNLSLYGMSYGLGFSLGPFGISLQKYGMYVPFVLLAVMLALVFLLVLLKLPNMKPEKQPADEHAKRRFSRSYRWAWYALLPAFLYGYMEASMNSNFPVYGLRIGYSQDDIALLLPFIGIGGLVLQMPLGILSDRIGRRNVLIWAAAAGGLLFVLIPFSGTHLIATLLLLLLAGGLVGSFFSLGLAYAADLLPKQLLPAANVLASFHFNAGSILGPNMGGKLLDSFSFGSLFFVMGAVYILFGLIGLGFKPEKRELQNHQYIEHKA